MSSSGKCSDALLRAFSLRHYTYINQFFGDETIREMISEIYPSKKFEFIALPGVDEFRGSYHHVLKYKSTEKILCSAAKGYQNLNINVNDTLCQSYSLLSFFGKKINSGQIQRQKQMIAMYRNLLQNAEFINKLHEVIQNAATENKKRWVDYSAVTKKTFIKMGDTQRIIIEILRVLNEWEQYGYWFFVGDGKCPK